MALTPLLVGWAPRLAAGVERVLPARLTRGRQSLASVPAAVAALEDHVIVAGYGVNGRNLARVLGRVGIPFVVVDINPDAVRLERRRGRTILYGDATRLEVLEHAGVRRARILVIAISDAAATRAAAALARRLNPRIRIVVRSRYVQEVDPLLALGVDEVVPEEFETSVEIFARVLRRYLVPRDRIAELTREVRQGAYEMFRAPWDGQTPPRALRRFLGDLTLEVYRAEPGSAVAGQALRACGLREQSGATVVAIQRPSAETIVNPTGSARVEDGDMVLVLGRPEQLASAARMFDGRANDGRE
jgi:CPA2 family monovalent cation:H+ antiporter-2